MTDLDKQMSANAHLVEYRAKAGDLAEYARQVDHLAYFPKRSRDDAAADLSAAGFHVTSIRRGLRRCCFEFSREDAVHLEAANAFTREVVAVVDRHGGEYDGWASFLVEEPPTA